MKVLFAASECAPIAKVGGLGDVIGSLPKALEKLGVDIKVVIPFYESIDRKKWRIKEINKLRNYEIRNEKIRVYKTKLSKSKVEVFLVYNKKYLSRGPIYSGRTAFVESVSEVDRFVFFSQAISRLFMQINADQDADQRRYISDNPRLDPRKSAIGWQPDIVHCHDWHTGALVKIIRTSNPELRTIFTIHNLANQGHTNSATLAKWLGVRESARANKDINLITEGIKNADFVTTVSPTYAKEIQTKQYGAGLEKLLRQRAAKGELTGILNGIDYAMWPIEARGKVRRLAPKFGFVARLTYQKGLSLILPLVPQFAEKYGAEFYFLGQGEKRFEDELRRLAKNYPKNVFVKIGFDEKFARWIYAHTDFFLMPSLFEPSGLGQMIAMHYGNVPVARAVGGLKDSVKPWRTGIMFKDRRIGALKKALEAAIEIFHKPRRFQKLIRYCRKQDFSWRPSAKKYLTLYKKILN
jgi:starch synthase